MERIRTFLKVFLFVQLGACLGRALWLFIDYKCRPMVYEAQSAPWYTGALVTAAFTAATAVLTLAAYLILGHIMRKREKAGKDRTA